MRLYNFLYGKTAKVLSALGLLLVGEICAECEINCAVPCNASSLQIGGSYTHANINIKGHKSFNGNLGGVQGIYEYKPWNHVYGGLKVDWKQGNTTRSHADRTLTYLDVQERIGYTYSLCCDNKAMTFFTGFGYRYLSHRLKQSGEHSVKFEYNEFYIPVGFLSEYHFRSCWALGLNFTWMPQVYPTVKITPLKGARWILKSSLDNVLVELPVSYFLTEDRSCSFILKPFYEHWEDGRSTAKAANGQKLDLPKNSYNFWGVELNLAFSF